MTRYIDAMTGEDEGFDVAQVCPNGHVTNSSFHNEPQFNVDYCTKCGEKTIVSGQLEFSPAP